MITFKEHHANASSFHINQAFMLSDHDKYLSIVIGYIGIAGSIAYFGIVGNIINLIIFAKQGYDNTMNISLSGIAMSDMCALLAMVWFSIIHNPYFENSEDVYVHPDIQYLTAGWPHCFFSRITCVITVYITVERCLCVAMPLKVKKIITKRKSVIVVVFLWVSQILSSFPTYYSTYIDWKFYPDRNRSLLGIYRIDNFDQVEYISFALQTSMQAASFVLLIFFTVLLLVSLKRKTEWRKTSTSHVHKGSISTRDKKLVRMVIFIATILIICFTPGMTYICAMAIDPEFTVGGFYDNVFYVSWSFGFVCQTVNSSVNILVYYNMSSKYRDTFSETFTCCRRCLGLNTDDNSTKHE